MKKPFFSIITPSYNRGYIIEKTIQSVLEQTFSDWEMIIIDDGSNDNTKDIVETYIEKDSRIYFYSLKENKGPNIARNFASEKANGEWLVFLDSDDSLTDNALEIAYEYIKKLNKVYFFIFNCQDLDGNIPINIKNYEGYIDYKDFLCCKIKGEALPIVRKDCFLEIKFEENIRGGEAIAWIKFLKKYGSGYFSNKVLRIYNNKLEDRLSIKKRNSQRLYQVYQQFLKNFKNDLIKTCPSCFIEIYFKFLFYKFFSLINK
jgi:glycosyltransferase involved in cell wall biosynthesis